ncbi:MFS transporter [Aeromicrobium ginsengisoli]|uniref:MFS transporter n=1 Tax=Aeromicrobium ginsengisoli TaxID=363867 RepID=A0A5M4FAT3_9ACTN|nr:MFS transporter [Aeromicrobium ginsengisoli]KAA1394359.1 MFS transporter [Aeromicrobium ginsengisoli]
MPPSAARRSTFAIFALNGFLLGMWVVNIPEIRDRTGASTVVLGYLLLLLGGSALLGMQVGGRLIDRFGSRVVVVIAGLVLSACLVGPGLATNVPALAVALALLGAFNGVIDVSQNAQAVEVERAYGRPIISAFHAFFSLGGLLASIIGGGLIALDVDVRLTLAAAGVLGLILTLVVRPTLLPPSPGTTRESGAARAHAPWTPRVVVLSLLAFMLLLSEGVAYDWSTVHLHDSLDASKTVAAWAFGAFSITMTLVRLVADRVVARIGAAAYVQRAALVGAAGLLGAALAPNPAVAIVAWAIFGVGLAGCVPQFFSAAGNIDPTAAGTYLARVTGTGYLGLLAGPAIIGILTNWVSLTTAFAVPIVGCLLAGLLAPSALRKEEA